MQNINELKKITYEEKVFCQNCSLSYKMITTFLEKKIILSILKSHNKKFKCVWADFSLQLFEAVNDLTQ